MSLLKNKNVVITGAAAGIGLSIAECFKAQGAELYLLDINATALEENAQRLQSHYRVTDVTDAVAVDAAINDAVKQLGSVDVLVNNAGTGAVSQLHNYSLDQFDQLMKDNLYSVFYCAKACIPLMQENGGVIVNIASETAERPTYGEAPYSAAKAGVVALTKSMGLEYGPAIRCNAISPGVIESPLTAGILDPSIIAPMIQQTPAGRVGSADEVAQTALFLASDMSSYMTGQNLIVDGGLALPQSGINDVTKMLVSAVEAQSQSQS